MIKKLSEITPFATELVLVQLASSRLIGREARCGGELGNTAPSLWDEVYGSGAAKTLSALPELNWRELLGWTCEYDPASDTFCYLVGVLAPADAPIPSGMSSRDVPETLCAVGVYGESVEQTRIRAQALGYEPNWDAEGLGWNAELSFSEEEASPPAAADSPWHWLVPIKKIN